MVRLKLLQFAIKVQEVAFQFHYGTIKTNMNNDFLKLIRQFQFHYGTIKTACTLYQCNINRKFQFHYGTIKTSKQDIRKRLF